MKLTSKPDRLAFNGAQARSTPWMERLVCALHDHQFHAHSISNQTHRIQCIAPIIGTCLRAWHRVVFSAGEQATYMDWLFGNTGI